MAKASVLLLLPGHRLFGQEQALLTLAEVLRTNGLKVHFMTHSKWGVEHVQSRLDELGFEQTALPLGTIWSLSLVFRNPKVLFGNLFGVFRSCVSLRRLLRTGGYTHLLTGNATFSYYLLPVLLFSNICIVFRHGDDAIDHSYFHRIMSRLLFARVDRHVANCEYLLHQLRSKFPRLSCSVIYNLPRNISSAMERPTAPRLSMASEKKRVLFIGQISEHKGVGTMLKAIRILASEDPEVVFDIVGDFSGVGLSKDFGLTGQLDAVIADFPTQVSKYEFQSDTSAFYRNADIHVCPSIWQEPSPNVIFEAKQFGVPSVAFRVGGIPEIVCHLSDGYLCPDKSAESLVAGIQYFLTDERRRFQAGAAAKRSVDEKFGIQRFQSQWLRVFSAETLIANESSGMPHAN